MLNEIHSSFQHGKNFKIGSFCVIRENVVVGDNVEIGNNAYIGPNSVIENNVFIDSHVKSSGRNKICSGVKLRFGVSIGRDLVIGENSFISPHCVILHQDHKQNGLTTCIGDNCFIGTSSVVNPGVSITSGSVVGSMSLVTKDITEPGTYVGSPARKIEG